MALNPHHPTQLKRFPEHEDLLVEQPVYRKGPAAPAPARVGAGEDEESCLGSVPHTLRGSLHAFTQVDQTRVDQLNLIHKSSGRPYRPSLLAVHGLQPSSVEGPQGGRLGAGQEGRREAKLPRGPHWTYCSHAGWSVMDHVKEREVFSDLFLFQDNSMMDGVIDLADDDCISFSSSCD